MNSSIISVEISSRRKPQVSSRRVWYTKFLYSRILSIPLADNPLDGKRAPRSSVNAPKFKTPDWNRAWLSGIRKVVLKRDIFGIVPRQAFGQDNNIRQTPRCG